MSKSKDPAGEGPLIPDYDPNDNLLDFLKEALARNRAPQPASRQTEPPGEAAREHCAPVNHIAVPPAQNQPALDAGLAAPPQHKQAVAVEPRSAENKYLDPSVDPETLYIPLVVFPRLNRVIPQSETDYVGWSAFLDAVAPTPAPVVQEKKDVPYVIAGTLQDAPLKTGTGGTAQGWQRR